MMSFIITNCAGLQARYENETLMQFDTELEAKEIMDVLYPNQKDFSVEEFDEAFCDFNDGCGGCSEEDDGECKKNCSYFLGSDDLMARCYICKKFCFSCAGKTPGEHCNDFEEGKHE